MADSELTRMLGLSIDEVSGVAAPAHLEDGWLVMKDAGSLRELLTAAAEKAGADDEDDDMAKDAGTQDDPTVEEQLEAANARIAELETQVATPPADDSAEVDIAKALEGLPEHIAKAVEAQTDSFRKEAEEAKAETAEALRIASEERDRREEREAIAKAKNDLSHIPVPPSIGSSREDLGRFIHRLEKAAGELGESFTKSVGEGDDVRNVTVADEVFDLLKSINGQLESAEMFGEIGSGLSDDGAGDDAHRKLERMAKARVADSNGEITFAKAYDQVSQENRDLLAQAMSE